MNKFILSALLSLLFHITWLWSDLFSHMPVRVDSLKESKASHQFRAILVRTVRKADLKKSRKVKNKKGLRRKNTSAKRLTSKKRNVGQESQGHSINPLGRIHPKYPYIAKELGKEGIVKFSYSLNSSGRPKSIKKVISSGTQILDDAALLALKEAQSKTERGLKRTYYISFKFSLKD